MACEPFDCSKCGQRHEICSGHVTKDENGNKIDPRPCTKYPREGAAVCQAHGGNAPQVIAAAKGRILESWFSLLSFSLGFISFDTSRTKE